ncbi:50S ribosomal protein L24 [archaeon]|nr:50S ribosomal protein L24 [archaeon]
MKQKFSTKWKASKQVRKQRKYLHNLPLHLQNKIISSHLSKELRDKYGMRNISIRTGDEVKVMRGSFKGKQGKVTKVEMQNNRVSIDGIQRKKMDGTKIDAWIRPSALMIKTLNLDDKKRIKTKMEKKTNALEKK